VKQIECPRCYGKGKVNFGNVSGRICFLCKGACTISEDAERKLYTVAILGHDVHGANVWATSELDAISKARKNISKRQNAPAYADINVESATLYIKFVNGEAI
jgi:hypothetical protein